MKRIALIGPPNVGKSSLFSWITGKFAKDSNYAGVTVQEDVCVYDAGQCFVDLPGIYSLHASGAEEKITLEKIQKQPSYDFFLFVLDSLKMETGISLYLSLKNFLKGRVLIILNKSDLLSLENIEVQKETLEEKLGAPVLVFNTRNTENKEDRRKKFFSLLNKHLDQSQNFSTLESRENQENRVLKINNADLQETKIYALQARKIVESCFVVLSSELQQSQDKKKISFVTKTKKIDEFLLHPFWGFLSFLFIFYSIFYCFFVFSTPAMEGLETLFSWSGEQLGSILQQIPWQGEFFSNLIQQGVIAGVGSILVFVPQIALLFFFLSLLEQSGYLARAAVVTDRFFSFFGLSGKAFLPFVSSFACSIPAIMSTRSLKNPRERLATLMVLPLVTCSARLPVYTLLIGLLVSDKMFGPFSVKALAFTGVYFLGPMTALIIAKIFRLTFFKGEKETYLLELPFYNLPSFKKALTSAYVQAMSFVKKIFGPILIFSVSFWLLSTYPNPKRLNQELPEGISQLEYSYVGKIGKTIAPVFEPLGIDWKMSVGILVSFGARELFVSSLGTLFALEGDVDQVITPLSDKLAPTLTLGSTLALLWFFVIACQCFSTLSLVWKETGRLQYAVWMFTYMFGLAYTGGIFLRILFDGF